MWKYRLRDAVKYIGKGLQYAIQLTICAFVGVSAMSFIAQFGIQLAMHSARAGLVDTAMGFVIIGASVGGAAPLAALIGYKLFGLLSKFVDKMNKRREEIDGGK